MDFFFQYRKKNEMRRFLRRNEMRAAYWKQTCFFFSLMIDIFIFIMIYLTFLSSSIRGSTIKGPLKLHNIKYIYNAQKHWHQYTPTPNHTHTYTPSPIPTHVPPPTPSHKNTNLNKWISACFAKINVTETNLCRYAVSIIIIFFKSKTK